MTGMLFGRDIVIFLFSSKPLVLRKGVRVRIMRSQHAWRVREYLGPLRVLKLEVNARDS